MTSIDPIKPQQEITEAEVQKHKGKLVVQRKYNGCRCTCTIDETGVQLWSRNISKVTKSRIPYTGKFPHILKELQKWNLPEGTILDGELVSFRGGDIEHFKDIKQSTGGHDATNVAFQKSTGYWATWIIFDIVSYGGKEVWRLPLRDRLEVLDSIFKGHNFQWIRLIRTEPFEGTIKGYEQKALENHWEGFVVKNLDSPYHYSLGKTARPSGTWWKIKPEKIADVIVTGFEYGTPGTKNEHRVGKLVCCQYDKQGKLHQVCRVGTGFSDFEREKYLHIEYPQIGMVKYAHRNENHHLIHPSWKGFRKDKTAEECIIEEL